jgi:hypothetical protein
MKTDRCVALLQGKSKKVKGKKIVGVLHLRHYSPTPHINLHLQMQNPLRFTDRLSLRCQVLGIAFPNQRNLRI